VTLPPGYAMVWSGQYENMLRVKERLKLVVPLTLVLIFFAAVREHQVGLQVGAGDAGGAVLGDRRGVAVLSARLQRVDRGLGRDDRAPGPRRRDRRVHAAVPRPVVSTSGSATAGSTTRGDLTEAIIHGAVKRVRPKAMTVCAAMLGLLPIMWSIGTGADLMKRVAAPMVGGLVTSFMLELLVYPPIYYLWRGRGLPEGPPTPVPARQELNP
jgi:Cu(I)/Ag(I) efflux system membrane protein CusA/SilA